MIKLMHVQEEIGTLSKNAKNPFFNSQYLDLNDLLNHVTPLLNKHGLTLTQPIEGGKVCSVISDDKEVIGRSELMIPPTITDPQKMGSCITYFRRYTLKSLLAISEVDDDGNKASKEPTKAEVEKAIETADKKATLTAWKPWISHYNLTELAMAKVKELS